MTMPTGKLNSGRAMRLETTPVMVTAIIVAVAIGLVIGLRSPSVGLLVGGTLALGIILALRQDQFTAVVVVAVSLLQDWYRLIPLPVTFPVISIVIALALVAIIFFGQSAEHPWVRVPMLWVWLLLLGLAAPHMLQTVSTNESARYYAQVFVNGLAMWMLGVQVVRDLVQLRRLLILLSAFGTLIAIHSIILGLTGRFILETSNQVSYLASVSDFRLTGTTLSRAGSFIGSPDWNGTLMAMLAIPPIGLLLHATSVRAKIVFGAQFAAMLLALFVTYSTAAWAAIGVGLAVLLLLSGRRRTGLYLLAAAFGALLCLTIALPAQMRAMVSHFTASGQLSLRLGAWETALRVIQAYPLTGIGLGWTSYLDRANPFRVAQQTIPLGHPHDAYLEVAAMAGLPTLVVFGIVLVGAFVLAMRSYRACPARDKVLVAGVLAALVALTFNSVAINGWTLPPIAAIGWLLAGAAVSPALRVSFSTAFRPADASAAESAPRESSVPIAATRSPAPTLSPAPQESRSS